VSAHGTFSDRFAALPRSVHWLLYAVIAVVIFLVWDTVIGEITADLNRKADRIEEQVRTVRESRHDAQRLRGPQENLIVGFGPVEAPATPNESSKSLGDLVVAVLAAHGVSKEKLDLGGGATLPRDVSRSILAHSRQFSDRRLKTVTGTLAFDATPDKAIAIIRDFEEHPEVEAVTKVQFKKSSGGRVTVNLELEAWAIGAR
jgi:hypothetical protein